LAREFEQMCKLCEESKLALSKLRSEVNFLKSEGSFSKKELERYRREKELLSENSQHMA
jgi:hypothetical protein